MKLTVKTLKGQQFDVQVDPDAKVIDVKAAIEAAKGEGFPRGQQKLIHQGKVLKDDTTLREDNVTESGFVVVMVVQGKASQPTQPAAASASGAAAPAAPGPSEQTTPPAPEGAAPAPAPAVLQAPVQQTEAPAAPAGLAPTPVAAVAADTGAEAGVGAPGGGEEGQEYQEVQAASTLLAGAQLEATVQQILDMGGGSWDKATVLRALRAAFNNPERAIEYLYSGIPEMAEVPPPVSRETAAPAAGAQAGGASQPTTTGTGAGAGAPAAGTAAPGAVTTGVPNVTPFNIFGQPGTGGGAPAGAATGAGAAGPLDFLRTNPQFQGLRAMVQTNPALLQPMLQELAKQNPDLLRLITSNQAEFRRLLSEPAAEGDLFQLAAAAAAAQGQQAPVAVNVTPEEGEAISRLEAMGFDRQLVIEAFFACDKNEQLAANYLLEHGAEFED